LLAVSFVISITAAAVTAKDDPKYMPKDRTGHQVVEITHATHGHQHDHDHGHWKWTWDYGHWKWNHGHWVWVWDFGHWTWVWDKFPRH
jgi:hypothetical protein